MKNNPLIAGIDPGTTTGYAFLDLEGNIVHSGSSRNMGIDELIRKSLQHGNVIVACSDKKNTPFFTEKYSIKVGAKLISPSNDLTINEKKDLLKGKVGDSHESDALAAAYYAFKKLRSLIKKINLYIERNDASGIANELYSLVIKEGIGISTAAMMLTSREDHNLRPGFTEDINSEETDTEMIPKQDVLKLLRMLKQKDREIDLLRQIRSRLENDLEKERKEKRRMIVKIRDVKRILDTDKLLRNREQSIHQLSSRIEMREKDIENYGRRVGQLYSMLSGRNSVILKKLPHLGSKGFEARNKILKIGKGDVLLVDDMGIISSNIVEFLAGKVEVLVCRKMPSKKLIKEMPFTLIDASKLKIDEEEYYAAADPDELQRQKAASGMLQNIINQYQKERLNRNPS